MTVKIRQKDCHDFIIKVQRTEVFTDGIWYRWMRTPPQISHGTLEYFGENVWEEVPQWTRWDGVSIEQRINQQGIVIKTPDGCTTYIPLPYDVRARMIENGLIQFEKRIS